MLWLRCEQTFDFSQHPQSDRVGWPIAGTLVTRRLLLGNLQCLKSIAVDQFLSGDMNGVVGDHDSGCFMLELKRLEDLRGVLAQFMIAIVVPPFSKTLNKLATILQSGKLAVRAFPAARLMNCGGWP